MKNTAFLFLFLLCCTGFVFAQSDQFTGTWEMRSGNDINDASFGMELQIAKPERNCLYPAQLKLRYNDFSATYELLLVRKNDTQLAIGRSKYAIHEAPFSIGNFTVLLNGTLDLGEDPKGNVCLRANRLLSKRYGISMPSLASFPENQRTSVMRISDYMKNGIVSLQKSNDNAWQSADINKLLYTYEAPTYFGLIDTLYTNKSEALLNFSDNKKDDRDSVSVMLNGKMIIQKMDISSPLKPQEIHLDSGLNILCFFADNYGKIPPNTAKLQIKFSDFSYPLDFTTTQNMSATFIVAKIYFYPDKKRQVPKDITDRRRITEVKKHRQTTIIDSIRADAQDITLAIWDDAVQDGDSISIQINEDIFMPGIAVKKKPQFIQIHLNPGENKILFIADNLGSIPPNTAILEIIDGKRRKAYNIDTNLGKNNAIKILYNLPPSH